MFTCSSYNGTPDRNRCCTSLFDLMVWLSLLPSRMLMILNAGSNGFSVAVGASAVRMTVALVDALSTRSCEGHSHGHNIGTLTLPIQTPNPFQTHYI